MFLKSVWVLGGLVACYLSIDTKNLIFDLQLDLFSG